MIEAKHEGEFNSYHYHSLSIIVIVKYCL